MIQISTEKQKALREAMAELTEEHQEVMNWLIENYDAAVEICKAKTLTENESQKVYTMLCRNMTIICLFLPF